MPTVLNNFIHRETVEVQYKQRAIQQQTAITRKKTSIAKQQVTVTYNSCNLAKHYTLYSVIITMPVFCFAT